MKDNSSTKKTLVVIVTKVPFSDGSHELYFDEAGDKELLFELKQHFLEEILSDLKRKEQ